MGKHYEVYGSINLGESFRSVKAVDGVSLYVNK